MKKYLSPTDSKAYEIAFELSNYVWNIFISWDYFAKKTVGIQFVTSVDSISASIAEGFGRYFKKDKINFFRYARGSTIEAIDWNEKAMLRMLLSEPQYLHIKRELEQIPFEINLLIKITNEKLRI